MPAIFTVAGFVAFTNVPPFHVSAFPALVPVKVDVNTEHVILPELMADVIIGKVVFDVTATTVDDEQPTATSLDVTV